MSILLCLRSLLLSALMASSLSFAANPCAKYLQPGAASFSPSWLARNFDQIHQLTPDNDHYTVRVEPLTQGDSGEWLIHRVPGKTWYSTHGPFQAALQGDPRFPLMLLGPEVGEVLGLRMIDDATIIYPSVQRLNHGIERLNAHLPANEQIHYRFYAQTGDLEEDYVQRLNDGFQLPISVDKVYVGVHDMSIHLGILVAPVAFEARLKVITSLFELHLEEAARLSRHNQGPDDSLNYPQLLQQINTMTDNLVALPSKFLRSRMDPTTGGLDQSLINLFYGIQLFGANSIMSYLSQSFDKRPEAKRRLAIAATEKSYELLKLPTFGYDPRDYYRAESLRRAQLRKAALAAREASPAAP